MKMIRISMITLLGIGLLFVPLFWLTEITVIGLIGYGSICIGNILVIWNAIAQARRKGEAEEDSAI